MKKINDFFKNMSALGDSAVRDEAMSQGNMNDVLRFYRSMGVDESEIIAYMKKKCGDNPVSFEEAKTMIYSGFWIRIAMSRTSPLRITEEEYFRGLRENDGKILNDILDRFSIVRMRPEGITPNFIAVGSSIYTGDYRNIDVVFLNSGKKTERIELSLYKFLAMQRLNDKVAILTTNMNGPFLPELIGYFPEGGSTIDFRISAFDALEDHLKWQETRKMPYVVLHKEG